MSLYVVHFSSKIQSPINGKEFFYHTDVLIKKTANIYRRKIKIIDIFSKEEFDSKVLPDKRSVVFFIKNQFFINDFCNYVISECAKNNIPIILKDNYSRISLVGSRINSISSDMSEKANTILNYCFANQKSELQFTVFTLIQRLILN